jgi:hypothetical protein
MKRLVARGYDGDIERYLQRRLKLADEHDRKALEAQQARLGWTPLHVAVEAGSEERIQEGHTGHLRFFSRAYRRLL